MLEKQFDARVVQLTPSVIPVIRHRRRDDKLLKLGVGLELGWKLGLGLRLGLGLG